jgi:hypothetical protein
MPRVSPSTLARLALAAALLAAAGLLALRSSSSPAKSTAGPTGYVPDPAGVALFLDELGRERFFADAAPESMRRASGEDVFLYRAMLEAHQARYGRPFVVGRQLNGSCVAWGAMHAVLCSESLSWKLGKRSEPPKLPSTEAIYGGARCEARNRTFAGWSDGATGWGAARWLRDWGVIYREPYPELGLDLTTYSKDLEKNWGAYGCGGEHDAGRLDAIAKKRPARHIALVRTWAELEAALEAGFPVTVASSQGFTSTRDQGFCRASGTWMHQMAILGLVHAKNAPPHIRQPKDGALILNSWGPDYLGGDTYTPDQPAGSFYADRATVEKMLAQGDSYAIGDIDSGFAWRDINHTDWLAAPPPADTLEARR